MNIVVKSEKIQELEVVVDELYNKEILPIYIKKYGMQILPVVSQEIKDMKAYLIYEYMMQCLKDQEPEVNPKYIN